MSGPLQGVPGAAVLGWSPRGAAGLSFQVALMLSILRLSFENHGPLDSLLMGLQRTKENEQVHGKVSMVWRGRKSMELLGGSLNYPRGVGAVEEV